MHGELRFPSRLMAEHRGCEQVGYVIAGDDGGGSPLVLLWNGDVRGYMGRDGLCADPSCT